jgi:hypothetical protein
VAYFYHPARFEQVTLATETFFSFEMTSPIGLQSCRHFCILTHSAADLPICELERRGFFSKHIFTVFRARPQYKSWKSGERDDPRNKPGVGFSICRSNIKFLLKNQNPAG